jgi:hypothetical protein
MITYHLLVRLLLYPSCAYVCFRMVLTHWSSYRVAVVATIIVFALVAAIDLGMFVLATYRRRRRNRPRRDV